MSNWQHKSLGEFIELKRGYDLPSRDRLPGAFPLVTSSGPTEFISQSKAKGPGVVTGRYGTIGQVFYVKEDFWPLNTALYVKDFRGNLPRFVYYFLHILDWEKFNDKSGVPGINRNDVHREPIFVPPIDQQNQIATVLGGLDDKIQLNRRMKEALEELALAVFRDWFVDFGPVRRKQAGAVDPVAIIGGLSTDDERAAEIAALFPDALGEKGMPIGWNVESLLDQAHWINGAAYKNMHFVSKGLGLPVIKIAELKAGVSDQTKFTNTDLGQKYRINDGELLFSWSGNPDTSIDAFIWTGGKAWLNQHIFAVRENGKMDLPTLHTLLKWLMPQFAELARNKQTTGLGHVTKDDMKRLLIAKPPQPVATAFSTIVGPIFERIIAMLYESRTLAETRDYLLPRLMSGAVRVTTSA